MKNRFCLTCLVELKGRSDKKFSNDLCRSQYHNQNIQPHHVIIKEINNQLKRNRKILAHFCPNDKAIVRKELIDQLGFVSSFFTHIYMNNNRTYYFCYDYGFCTFLENNTNKLFIVYNKDYKI